MEKLKKLVPDKLKREIAETSSGNLLSTSSSLLDFFFPLQEFHLIVGDLADPEKGLCAKNEEAAKELKQTGNQCYSNGNYSDALSYYSKALRVAPLDAQDKGKDLVSVLYVNRAAVLYKLGSLVECQRDCDRALQVFQSYAKAWFWRGKVNAALGEYNASSSDLKIANIMEESLNGKKQIENELKIAENMCKGSSCSSLPEKDHNCRILDNSCEVNLKCVSTPDKGRGMATTTDLLPSSLVHVEEPYAAVILKKNRETHCHYCFNELPVDEVPCTSCSIHLYCSEHCHIRAGGNRSRNQNKELHGELPSDLINYMKDITIGTANEEEPQHFPEHKHECLGANWPAVLPPEVVLAGRIISKFLMQRRDVADNSDLVEALDLFHSLEGLPLEIKLELHIYSMVLLFCLQNSCICEIPVNAASLSKIVVLLCKIRLNSMAVVRMKSADLHGHQITSTVEQVRVGQALYESGSLFNHSCQPNIHVYFLSRTLHIRTTEPVTAGSPLEFSYGPQIGEWKCNDRLKFLEEEYLFRCQCIGCSTLTLSDLALGGFHCINSDCLGIVLEISDIICEKQKFERVRSVTNPSSLEPYLQIEKLKSIDIGQGYCLNCGSCCDLDSLCAAVDRSWSNIRRLEDALTGNEISRSLLSSALESLRLLRLRLHLYNRRIAEAEDIIAQSFCSTGELQSALGHCKASIEILEKLYNPNHIVIGYELLKLISIQISLGDSSSAENIRRLRVIFECYYGSHTGIVFPYLESLKIDPGKSVS